MLSWRSLGMLALTSLTVGGLAGPLTGAPLPYASNLAYRQLLRLQRGVTSSIATIEVHTKMRSFPPVSITLKGHSYFQAPDQQAVVFDNVSGILKGMIKDSPSLAPAAMWPQDYDVTIASDDGASTTFHLISRDPNDVVQTADVTVDDRSGEIGQLNFMNRNGSESTNQQTYGRFGSRDVVVSSTGSTHGPGYKADTETTFSDYQFNVPIPPDVFEKK
jgi:hypothetical protein